MTNTVTKIHIIFCLFAIHVMVKHICVAASIVYWFLYYWVVNKDFPYILNSTVYQIDHTVIPIVSVAFCLVTSFRLMYQMTVLCIEAELQVF